MKKMTYAQVEVVPCKLNPADWRVEAIDSDGGCEVAVFSGRLAQERAQVFRNVFYRA